MAVLFADLSGFTSLSEQLDSEDVRSMLDRCMEQLGAIVDLHGGFIDKVIGDALMALFGVPVAHGDDSERAVRAALEMQCCSRERPDCFGGLPLRVGINTGEVIFAPLGPERRREFTVIGDPVNTASRLQSAAPLGGVLVGKETYQATCRVIRYEPVKAVRARGKQRPVPVWLAIEPLSTPAERPLSSVATVGRSAEFELLAALWEQAVRESAPRAVTILGSAGIGKTRLVREFACTIEERGGRAVWGASVPYGKSAGYGAFSQLIRNVAGIFETDSSPEAAGKLGVLVADLVGELNAEAVTSHLQALSGLSTVDTVDDREALFASACQFIEALAARQPVLLAFENIHWAERSLLDLVESLAMRVRRGPVLLLALARQELLEARPRWGGDIAGHTSIPLEPLSATHTRDLAVGLLSRVPNVEAAVGQIERAAGGNPLFVEELAASFSEGSTDVTKNLPANLKEMIAARLDALPMLERRVILDASVVGEVFWGGVLVRLASGNGRRLAAALESLERRGFIRPGVSSRIQGDEEFSFKHGLIRAVAYGTLPKAARRRRHGVVAEFIEERAGSAGLSAAVLAFHWREAGVADKAVDYLLLAGEQARRGWAQEEAVAIYDQALNLIPTGDEVHRRRARLGRVAALQTLWHRDFDVLSPGNPPD